LFSRVEITILIFVFWIPFPKCFNRVGRSHWKCSNNNFIRQAENMERLNIKCSPITRDGKISTTIDNLHQTFKYIFGWMISMASPILAMNLILSESNFIYWKDPIRAEVDQWINGQFYFRQFEELDLSSLHYI
jgi:hypothetical protein